MQQLFIWLNQQGMPGPTIKWWVGENYIPFDSEGSLESGNVLSGSSLESLSDCLDQFPQISNAKFVVKGDGCLSVDLAVPSNNMRALTKALPYMVEDSVIEDVEDFHFTTGKKPVNRLLETICVSRKQMDAWVELASTTGLTLAGMVPEYLCVPLEDKGWTFYIGHDEIIIRKGPMQGVTVPKQELTMYLDGIDMDLISSQYGEEDFIVKLFSHDPDQDHMLIADIENHLGHDLNISLDVTEVENPNPFWSQNYPSGVNLLQADYKQKIQKQKTNSKASPIYGLVASLFFIGLFGMHYQANVLEAQAQQIHVESENLFKSLFPSAGKNSLRSMRREMRSRMGSGGDSGNQSRFLRLFDEFGSQLEKLKLLDQVQIESVRFSGKRSELDLQLQAKAVSQLEKLKQAISAAGISADIASVANEDGVVKSRMKIGGSSNG